MQVIFDMDGVLIDSHEAVRQAYAEVGVSMPQDAWDKPWNEWLSKIVGSYKQAVIVHSAKNTIYSKMLERNFKPLFPAIVAQELVSAGHTVCVATGASRVAADLVLEKLGLRQSIRLLGASLKLGQKKSNVRSASRLALKQNEHTIYVDDNVTIVNDINAWNLPHVRAINYTQDDRKFVEEFEQTWTRLSSLQERMNA